MADLGLPSSWESLRRHLLACGPGLSKWSGAVDVMVTRWNQTLVGVRFPMVVPTHSSYTQSSVLCWLIAVGSWMVPKVP